MKIRLFENNQREEWTDLSRKYDREISDALEPIFVRAKQNNHSLRDLSYIANAVIVDLTVSQLIWDD